MFLPNADKREVASRGRKSVDANPSVNRCPQGAAGVLPHNLLLTAAVLPWVSALRYSESVFTVCS